MDEQLVQKIWHAGNQSLTAVRAVLDALKAAGYVVMASPACSECRQVNFHKMDCSQQCHATDSKVRPNCF